MKTIEERFWSKVLVIPFSECWLWTGEINEGGYGLLYIKEKARPAHRVSWELNRGSIPEKLKVCHKCDNPPCVRPDHLFLGTQRDNVYDMIKKGRMGLRGQNKGVINGACKLSPELVLEIRADNRKRCEIARHYKISDVQVFRIKNRINWKHV
jgi:hypothetical protein